METATATAYRLDLGLFNEEVNTIVPKLNHYLANTLIKDRIHNLDEDNKPQESSNLILQHIFNEKDNSITCVFLILGDRGLKGLMLNELNNTNYDVNKIYFNEEPNNFENIKKLIFLYIKDDNLIITDEKYVDHIQKNISTSIEIPMFYTIRSRKLEEVELKNLKSIEIGNNYNGNLINNSELLALNKTLTQQINKRTTNIPTIKEQISLENAFELTLKLKVNRNQQKKINDLNKTLSLIPDEKIILTIGDKKIFGNELIHKKKINLVNAEGMYNLRFIHNEMDNFLNLINME